MLADVGDVVTLKKAHPCGSYTWEVIRAGADFKLKCLGCGHVVLLDYDTLRKRMRRKAGKEIGIEEKSGR